MASHSLPENHRQSGEVPEANPLVTFALRRVLPLLVACLVLLGLVARLRQYLAGASWWYDEAYLLLNIFDKNWLGLLGHLRDDQAGPPLFFWTLRALYLVGGSSEYLLRAPALLASVVALALMIVVARRLIPHSGWLWAVGFCAAHKQGVDRAAEAKPYPWDFLMTLVILLVADSWLRKRPSDRRFAVVLGLCGVALFAPWCSLPSLFVLGGASLALLCDAIRTRSRKEWAVWLGFTLLFVLSAGLLYQIVVRYQHSPALNAWWTPYYPPPSLPGFLVWLVNRLLAIGRYCTNGLAVPMMLFAVAGGVLVGRRSPARLLLIAGPIGAALVAGIFRLYPLEDRLVFFVIPCWFLLGAETLGAVAESAASWGARGWGVVTVVVLIGLLIPGIGPVVDMVRFAPPPGFREAFDYVHQHARAGDVYWVSHPQVFEIYHRPEQCLGTYHPREFVVQQAQGHRLWVIVCSCGTPELEQLLIESGFVVVDAWSSRNYVARLYDGQGIGTRSASRGGGR